MTVTKHIFYMNKKWWSSYDCKAMKGAVKPYQDLEMLTTPLQIRLCPCIFSSDDAAITIKIREIYYNTLTVQYSCK